MRRFGRANAGPLHAILWALVGVQLVLAAWVAVRAGGGTSPSIPPSSGELAGVSTPVSIEGGMAAEALARAWRSEAKFVAATMHVDWRKERVTETTSVSPYGWIVYVFGEGDGLLSMTIDRHTGVVLGQMVGKGNVAGSEPPITTYPISSTIAVLTAELMNGNTYRAQCPAHRSVTMVGLAGDGADRRPVWVVTYGDDRRPTEHDVHVRIDATSGEVLNNVVSVSGCEEG